MGKNIYTLTFVLRGKNRKAVLKALEGGRKTQAELHKATGMYRTHVRRTLNEIISKGLVKCLNPKDRIYKMYELTEKGKKALAEVKKAL